MIKKIKILCGLVGYQVWYLITGCHVCVGSTPQVTILKTRPNMTLAVEWDVKPQF